MQRRLDQQAQRLDRLALQIGRPARLLAQQGTRLQALQHRQRAGLLATLGQRQRHLDGLALRLAAAPQQQAQRQADRLARLALRLAANDPQRVLAQGYAWLADAAGRPVIQAAGLATGARLLAQWADGRATLDVVDVLDVLDKSDVLAMSDAKAGPARAP